MHRNECIPFRVEPSHVFVDSLIIDSPEVMVVGVGLRVTDVVRYKRFGE